MNSKLTDLDKQSYSEWKQKDAGKRIKLLGIIKKVYIFAPHLGNKKQ